MRPARPSARGKGVIAPKLLDDTIVTTIDADLGMPDNTSHHLPLTGLPINRLDIPVNFVNAESRRLASLKSVDPKDFGPT